MFLEAKHIHTKYGKVDCLKGVSVSVAQGEIVALLGANGAGKTTTLKTISGIIQPVSGEVLFQKKSLGGLLPEEIVRRGIAHAPEGRKIFQKLDVLENLELGAFVRRDHEIGKDLEEIFALFPVLKQRRHQKAGTLSGGEQQMLAIGRALMSRPSVLLLDEPSLGLAPILVSVIFNLIRKINEKGMTILLVEQNARMALKIAHRAYVLETGQIVLEGKASDLRDNPTVKNAYLGGG